MVGGQLVRVVRHKRRLCGFDILKKRQELISWIALDVEFGRYHRFELIDILLANMSFVRTRMDGYTLCSEELTIHSKTLNVRHIATACVAERSHLVDINT